MLSIGANQAAMRPTASLAASASLLADEEPQSGGVVYDRLKVLLVSNHVNRVAQSQPERHRPPRHGSNVLFRIGDAGELMHGLSRVGITDGLGEAAAEVFAGRISDDNGPLGVLRTVCEESGLGDIDDRIHHEARSRGYLGSFLYYIKNGPQNLFSFAGNGDRSDVDVSVMQPILNYGLGQGWSRTSPVWYTPAM